MFLVENSPLTVPVPTRNSEDVLPFTESLMAAGRQEVAILPEWPRNDLDFIQGAYRKLHWMTTRKTLAEPEPNVLVVAHANERSAVRSFHGSIKSVLEMPAEESGDVGERFQNMYDRLFPDKLGLLVLPREQLWTKVEIMLEAVNTAYKPDIRQYGGGFSLSVLQRVHKEFGEVLNLTKAEAPVDDERIFTQVRALLFLIRVYIVHLIGWVAVYPEHKEVVERCLLPVKKWQEKNKRVVVKPDPDGNANDDGSTPASGAAEEGDDSEAADEEAQEAEEEEEDEVRAEDEAEDEEDEVASGEDDLENEEDAAEAKAEAGDEDAEGEGDEDALAADAAEVALMAAGPYAEDCAANEGDEAENASSASRPAS